MKEMEYTIKVTTKAPVDVDDLCDLVRSDPTVSAVECSNYRIKPQPRKPKE